MILVTGGAGYIGSHTTLELICAGYDVLVYDNLSNSSVDSINRLAQITGIQIPIVKGDILDINLLREVFSNHSISSVLHFAGLKSVSESVKNPLKYFQNNVVGSQILFQVMAEFDVKSIVFSSSATVYGDSPMVPIREDFPTGRTSNPYGTSKYIVERMLADICAADSDWSAIVLRYFNPVGAHESGLIGEDPNGIPNNLVPYISQVAVGKLECLNVYGNDYDTPDGTGIRDYIHVVDLAVGHVSALKLFDRGFNVFNLGTGRGVSVLEMIAAFEAVSGRKIPFRICERRLGDIAQCYSDPANASKRLDWSAKRSLEDMVHDTWRWQSNNPNGYK